jgi:hypothetical protein
MTRGRKSGTATLSPERVTFESFVPAVADRRVDRQADFFPYERNIPQPHASFSAASGSSTVAGSALLIWMAIDVLRVRPRRPEGGPGPDRRCSD